MAISLFGTYILNIQKKLDILYSKVLESEITALYSYL